MDLLEHAKHVRANTKDEILKIRESARQREEQVAVKLRNAVEERERATENAEAFATVTIETLRNLRALKDMRSRLDDDIEKEEADEKIRVEELMRKYADEKARGFTVARIEADKLVAVLEEEVRLVKETNQKEREHLLLRALATVDDICGRNRKEAVLEAERLVASYTSAIDSVKKSAADCLAEYDTAIADYKKSLTEAIQNDSIGVTLRMPIFVPADFPVDDVHAAANHALSAIDVTAAAAPVSASAMKSVSRQQQDPVEEDDIVIMADSDKQPGRKRAREPAKKALGHAREKDGEASLVRDERGEQERLGKAFHPDDVFGIFAARCMTVGFFEAMKNDAWWVERHGSRFDEFISKFAEGKPEFMTKFRAIVQQRLGNVPLPKLSDRVPATREECWICGLLAGCSKTICMSKNGPKQYYPVGFACAQFIECLNELLLLIRKHAYPSKRQSLMTLRIDNANTAVEKILRSVASMTKPPASKPSATKRAKATREDADADAEHVVQVPRSKK